MRAVNCMLVSAQVDLNLWRDHTASRPGILWESVAWKALRGQIFLEASEIFSQVTQGRNHFQ